MPVGFVRWWYPHKWVQKSAKWVPGNPILAFSGLGPRIRQDGSQEVQFSHFLASGPEVDKMQAGGRLELLSLHTLLHCFESGVGLHCYTVTLLHCFVALPPQTGVAYTVTLLHCYTVLQNGGKVEELHCYTVLQTGVRFRLHCYTALQNGVTFRLHCYTVL